MWRCLHRGDFPGAPTFFFTLYFWVASAINPDFEEAWPIWITGELDPPHVRRWKPGVGDV
ncbi:MAG: hypothetical protein LBS49_10585 [Candidatus Accumulibacter sp.]|jgi:hypothetical protein|nr:hypothetical protein [Accumulibacter sp.]